MSGTGHPVGLIAALGVVVTVTAAARSTWSPCGLSMLSTITPMAERGRGHRFRSTAWWFVVGAVVGGATLGGVMAALALAVRALALPGPALVVAALVAAATTTLSDVGLTGHRLPYHCRQVNERWLDRFRPWVYGAGFGWQIGCGLATYIVTAGVYLMIVLGAVSGRPWVALGLGTLFGLVRGVVVFVGRSATDPAGLRSLHLRLARLAPVSAAVTVAAQAAVALVAAVWVVADLTGVLPGRSWPPVAMLVATLSATVLAMVSLSVGWWGLRAVVGRRRRPAAPPQVELARAGANRG
jgi:hypothetical protein